MTTYDWPTMRDRAIDRFHESPGAQLEDRIIAHFKEQPGRVKTLIDSIAVRVDEGAIRHGWAILDKELATVPPDVRATDASERQKQTRIAEAWIRNAGGYHDRETELLDELFGHTGRLKDWPDLKPRMVAYWREQRHRFQQAEAEHQARCHAQASLRAELRARIRKATSSAVTRELADQQADLVTADVARRTHLDELAATVDLDAEPGDLEP